MDDQQYIELLRAIRDHSGLELASIREAGQHGADAGWAGFTYTSDGADFYNANRRLIVDVLSDAADDMGYPDVAAFVASFTRSDMTDSDGGYECLCSWYILETVGQHLADRKG